MKLVIIEGPGKRDTLKKYLGSEYDVVATKGHIRDLPVKSMGVDFSTNFEPKYEIMPGKESIIKELKDKSAKAEKVLLATDPDREGEAISWHIGKILNISENEPCRVEFNEISKSVVNNAVLNPRKINMDLVHAQQGRRILDRLVGYKISPIICKKIKSNLSAGRVQSVALKLVVDREKEIKNFKPKEYWNVSAVLNKDNIKFKAALATFKSKKFVPENFDQTNEVLEYLKNQTFKVETHRADKNFPLTSIEITKEVSRNLFRNIEGLKADVHNPDYVLNVEVRLEGTFIFTTSIPGLGGLPAGCLGKAVLMISGGIDSVVAGYMAIRKGISIDALHFAAPPYTSDMAVQKVIDLLEKLTPYTEFQNINLYIVPFTNIQKAIYDNCRDDYGITIMRRMMYRIAERFANEKDCLAIINGENVGQVASQTLESMGTIEEVTKIPVIRPLATLDKEEITSVSQKIDTYEISIRPYEDCCTVFVPKHPQIKPLLSKAIQEENKFDYETLITEALQNIERIGLRVNRHHSIISDIKDDIF